MVKSKKQKSSSQSDSSYFLKLVLYLILGSMWLKITTSSGNQIPIPIGLVIGVIFSRQEHFKIDRKIEYAVLLVAMLIGFWAPIGLYINL